MESLFDKRIRDLQDNIAYVRASKLEQFILYRSLLSTVSFRTKYTTHSWD